MLNTLKNFTTESLFDATSGLLSKLQIKFDRETAEAISLADFYDGPMPKYLAMASAAIDKTYFIGIINDKSLTGEKENESLEDVAGTIARGDKYDGMFVFACDIKREANLTRSAASALTRAFNRIASANPVILILRQGEYLSLATCERMEYTQAWRQGTGEKLGKVTILRNINCERPHRGHVDVLETLGEKRFSTFDELYAHWMEVFSSELLTKKFYNELSDWYAWAVNVAKFPNDLNTDEDDDKFNHEACIRLITRLIFVWFLKQKHLIPEEFFDEKYIRENLIENFNPHDKESLLYNSDKSMYYRLILQNLFFAMLNCPIVAEGKDKPNNRRFRAKERFHGMNKDYGINNLMRYESEFMEGGAEKFTKLANSNVPFLNGGLFDCLDDKPKRIYYDGFSEHPASLAQLFFPDYLFFGEEVGAGIDLSQWYDDKKKKNVSARGIIDILKRYSFTIEENTPFDQEVSLDPELLGKVFENLLAAYNPETKTSARKQTGSFYTPREIVQYMVDESLVAHLKRICGDEHEANYRSLISYATSDIDLPAEERKAIMNAIYNCRVLDPACGSGAFPMGVLQQMVHVLKRIDPTNELWNELMIDIAVADAKKELLKAADNESEKAKVEANRKARLDDIEEAFNSSINDPDYARKLYLIEHCIYGVDIQPIATQISKLRFFISLVVDQKPTSDPKSNFGIRPLPNLEAKFVTANTLIPLDKEENLFTASEEIRDYEEQLREINHKIFLAKRNKDKEELRDLMRVIRTHMAQALENGGYISTKGFDQLVTWNMFDQNASASFFDPEWMFGVKDGFDIVIANPPYINVENLDDNLKKYLFEHYETCKGRTDIYIGFIEKSMNLLAENATSTFIIPYSYTNQNYAEVSRNLLVNKYSVDELLDTSEYLVFENAMVKNVTIRFSNRKCSTTRIKVVKSHVDFENKLINETTLDTKQFRLLKGCRFETKGAQELLEIKSKIDSASFPLGQIFTVAYGVRVNNKKDKSKPKSFYIHENYFKGYKPFIEGKNIQRYRHEQCGWLNYQPDEHYNSMYPELFENEKIITINVVSERLRFSYDKDGLYNSHTVMNCVNINDLRLAKHISAKKAISEGNLNLAKQYKIKYILGVLNSQITNWYFLKFQSEGLHFYPDDAKNLPIPYANPIQQSFVELSVDKIIESQSGENEICIDHLVYHLYNLTYNEVLVIDPTTPITREEYEKFIV